MKSQFIIPEFFYLLGKFNLHREFLYVGSICILVGMIYIPVGRFSVPAGVMRIPAETIGTPKGYDE